MYYMSLVLKSKKIHLLRFHKENLRKNLFNKSFFNGKYPNNDFGLTKELSIQKVPHRPSRPLKILLQPNGCRYRWHRTVTIPKRLFYLLSGFLISFIVFTVLCALFYTALFFV